MRPLLSFLFSLYLAGWCSAFDEQLSLYGGADFDQLSLPAYGIEFASQVSQRLAFGIQADWQPASELLASQYAIAGSSRLLYSLNVDTQWYPAAGVAFQLSNNRFDPWLGLGIQREFFDILGGFSQIQWHLEDKDIRAVIGLRIWLTGFGSLDSRMKQAQPVGAVYRGEPVHGQSTLIATQISKPIEPQSTEKVITNVAPVIEPSVNTAPVKVEEKKQPPLTQQWFVHLGIFRQLESLQTLEQDSRLQPYRDQIRPWYDDGKSAFRLLLGPYTKAEALKHSLKLKQQQLDNFLYRLQ